MEKTGLIGDFVIPELMVDLPMPRQKQPAMREDSIKYTSPLGLCESRLLARAQSTIRPDIPNRL